MAMIPRIDAPRTRPSRFAGAPLGASAPHQPIGTGRSAATPFAIPSRRVAQGVFWLLTAINFLNYLDRIVFVAVGPDLKHDLHLGDGQVGLASSAFLLVYALAALPMGLLADRGLRTRIIALGVAAWSLATWYTAISHTFLELFLGRAVLGIGEASYIPAGAALLVAYYPQGERAQVLSRWGASTLVGTAVGFLAGGFIAQHFGWRWAFVICGPPGLLLAWQAWRTPNRQSYDPAENRADAALQRADARVHVSWSAALSSLVDQVRATLRSPTVRRSVILQACGLIMTTPALVFVPIYLHEHFHITTQNTAYIAGAILIPGGVGGTLLGGIIADYLNKRIAGGRMLTVALSFGCAAPFFIFGFLANNLYVLLACAFVAITFLNMYNGPLNAIVQDVVPATLRSSAIAVVMTAAHLLGDVWSPTVVGWLAEHVTRHNQAHALVICAGPAILLGTIIAFGAVRVYAREFGQDGAKLVIAPATPGI